jgi:tetratricopeptide (TPR) repeat protein
MLAWRTKVGAGLRGRATIVAALVSGALALAPGGASAARGSAFAVSVPGADSSETLGLDALTHLRRGADYYERGDYERAETEFARVASLEPDWSPIRYNLGATAEAQGKIDLAIAEYQAFLPAADERQEYELKLRIDELERRRAVALEDHRKKMAANWAFLAGSIVLTGGSIAMITVGVQQRESLGSAAFVTLISLGSVAGAIGLPMLIGTPAKIARDRKHLKTMHQLTVAPSGGRHGAGATIAGRF